MTCYFVLIQTKKLTAKPLDPIPDNGISDLLRYGDPKARPPAASLTDAQQKMPAVENVVGTR
jgi:hypothetical protein